MGRTPQKSVYIYFAVLLATSLTFATGACFVWTSPIIPKFASSDPNINPIGHILNTSESAWVVSAMSLGLIFGPLITILLSRMCTKKTILLLAASPLVASHIITLFAKELNFFIVARFFMGIGSGAIWSILGNYIAELSEDSNRGLLGSLAGVMSSLGSLFVYIIGPYVQMSIFSLLNLIPLILFYGLFTFCVPDSPYDLIKMNNKEEAETSLRRLRRHSKVQNELAFIVESVESSARDKLNIYDLIRNKGLRKALIICVGLMIIQQCSGILAVVAYTQTIFDLSGSTIPSTISAMIIALMSTISCIVSAHLIDKVGRKVLLILSCTFIHLSLFTLGLHFFLLNNGKDVSMISWLPIVSLVIFLVAFNFGLVVLPWVILGEVFPSSIKPIGSTIVSLVNFSVSFIVTISFPYMIEYMGTANTFWTFSVIIVLGSIFCFVFVPETKGKNFQEILKMLQK